jgi:hypothetical protein
MAKRMKSHFIVQCGSKKAKKKFSKIKSASEAAMKSVARPKGPRVCRVIPVKLMCSGRAGKKCGKKMLVKSDPVASFKRTARGVTSGKF